MYRGIYKSNPKRAEAVRVKLDLDGQSQFHLREDVALTMNEKSGKSAKQARSARQRSLDNLRLDRASGFRTLANTKKMNSLSPKTTTSASSSRARQRAAFHKGVSRIRSSLAFQGSSFKRSPRSKGVISYDDSKTASPTRRFKLLSEETKLYIVRVLSRLQYSHFVVHHSALLRGFNSWKLFLLSARTHERVSRSANGHIIVRQKMKPMRALRDRIVRYSTKLRTDVMKIRIFRAWRAVVDEASKPFLRYKARMHMRRQLLRKVYTAWHNHVLTTKRLRFTISLKLQQNSHRRLSMHFGRWYRMWAKSKGQKNLRHLQKKCINHFMDKTRKTKKKHIWNIWVKNAKTTRHKKLRLHRQKHFLNRFLQRKAYRRHLHAFLGWQDFVVLRRKYRRFAAKMFRHSLINAFETWYGKAEESKRARLLCQRMLKRMMHSCCSACFQTWKANVGEQKRMRTVCQRIMKRLVLRKVAACFQTWSDVAVENTRLRIVGERVVARLLRKRLASSFSQWCDAVIENARVRNVCKRVTARWLRAGMVRSLSHWKDFVEQRVRDRNIVARWVANVLQREISAAMNTWKSFVVLSQKHSQSLELEKLKAQFSASQANAQRLRLQRVIWRFKQKRLISAFLGWQDFVILRRKYRRFAAKMFRHSLINAFETWYGKAEESKRARLLCQRMLKRMMHSCCSACFQTWKANVGEQKRMRTVCQRIMKRLVLRKVAACFQTWSDVAVENTRLRIVGERVVARLLRKRLASSFSQWCDAVIENARVRNVCKRVTARWLRAGMVRSLSHWKDFVEQRVRDRNIVARWVANVLQREISAAMNTWKQYTHWHKVEAVRYDEKHEGYEKLVGYFLKIKDMHRLRKILWEWRNATARKVLNRAKRGARRAKSDAKFAMLHANSFGAGGDSLTLENVVNSIGSLLFDYLACGNQHAAGSLGNTLTQLSGKAKLKRTTVKNARIRRPNKKVKVAWGSKVASRADSKKAQISRRRASNLRPSDRQDNTMHMHRPKNSLKSSKFDKKGVLKKKKKLKAETFGRPVLTLRPYRPSSDPELVPVPQDVGRSPSKPFVGGTGLHSHSKIVAEQKKFRQEFEYKYSAFDGEDLPEKSDFKNKILKEKLADFIEAMKAQFDTL